MTIITNQHFGGNVILTRDSFLDGQPFAETLKEIEFSGFRYPGGGVTEDQTWANGGLDRMFGDPIPPGSDNYVMTIREALEHSASTGKELTIVIPTFQFYDKTDGTFDHSGFAHYLDSLESALESEPNAIIKDFEIGNEYWGSKQWGSLTALQYGQIANAEIPMIHEMIERLSDEQPEWAVPDIGIQAGVQWKAEQGDDGKWTAIGPRDSEDIISQISMENRDLVGTIFQHSYPHADQIDQKIAWAVRPMDVFERAEGFSNDLKFSFSEFNIGANSALGVDQAGAWIEAFGKAVDSGIDSIDHWGISYDWLSNKFYDTKFPHGESDGGEIKAIATPMGQVYDIAQSHLIGKTTLTDEEALTEIDASDFLSVTGFEDAKQKIVFLQNPTNESGFMDMTGIPENMHVSLRHLKFSDAKESTWFDESARELHAENGIADSRGDMKVTSQHGVADRYTLEPGEMMVVVISDPDRDLVIEGAHNATDHDSNFVDDLIIGGNGNDILRGHVGNDTIEGVAGHNVLIGGKGDDLLIAGDDGDVIFSKAGDDTVLGGEGDDLFIIGQHPTDTGASHISGGGGMNLFLLDNGTSAIIEDFSDTDYVGFNGVFSDVDALHDAMSFDKDDLILDLGDGNELVLQGAADRAGELHEQVIDFKEHDEIVGITDLYLAGLNSDQLEEVSYLTGSDLSASQYFDDYETTLARLGVDPQDDDEGGYDDVAEPPETVDDVQDPPDDDVAGSGDNSDGDDLTGDDNDDDFPAFPGADEDEAFPEEDDLDDQEDDASGGACFVATAAYGDPHHPDVVAMRAFRDTHLIRFRAGRTFIRFYWIVGPKMAAFTHPQDWHARSIRFALTKLVKVLRRCRLTADR